MPDAMQSTAALTEYVPTSQRKYGVCSQVIEYDPPLSEFIFIFIFFLLCGRNQCGMLVAFYQSSGELAWQSRMLPNSHQSVDLIT